MSSLSRGSTATQRAPTPSPPNPQRAVRTRRARHRQDLSRLLAEYAMHPEAKSAGADGRAGSRQTAVSSLRRPVTARTITHIGKEANRSRKAKPGSSSATDEVLGPTTTPSTYCYGNGRAELRNSAHERSRGAPGIASGRFTRSSRGVQRPERRRALGTPVR